jgi:CBS domain-containing protein
MKSLESYCVRESASMEEAISAIQMSECRCVLVTNEADRVVGVFSEGDVLRAILAGRETHMPLKNLLKPNFKYLHEADEKAALEIFKKGITLVPVVDKDFHLKSAFTLLDFLEHL